MKRTGFYLYSTGYIVIIAATLVYIFSDWHWAAIIFGVGAVAATVGRYLTLPAATNFRIKRLNNMLAISAVLMLATAYLMFIEENIWAITLTIAAFIDIFTTFRYP